MAVPVNLYVDRMSPVQPVRVADLYSVTQDRASSYTEAAAKIGLTTGEYAEFRRALTEGGAVYVRLPRYIDAMAGVHRRSGRVYALHHVVVPSGTMGWQVNLADGTTVLIPRVCGNLSMNHARAIAHRPVVLPPPKLVAAKHYKQFHPVVIATPVTFEAPPVVAAASPVVAAPIIPVAHGSALPFLGLLFPIVAGIHNGGGGGSTPPAPPSVPSCTYGSNSLGVCQH